MVVGLSGFVVVGLSGLVVVVVGLVVGLSGLVDVVVGLVVGLSGLAVAGSGVTGGGVVPVSFTGSAEPALARRRGRWQRYH